MTIRRLPTDFLVEELLTGEFLARVRDRPDGPAAHAFYILEKTSLTTPDAAVGLARALGIPPGGIAHAGLKDKHARTTQHFTAALGSRTVELIPRTLEGRGWSARLLGWIGEPIAAAAIAVNRFTIVVRDMTDADAREMHRRADWLMDRRGDNEDRVALAVINYFGDQRFGSARHGHGFAARHLIKGEFEQALKLLIATPARKDSGKRRDFTRAAAAGWDGRDWKTLVECLPRCPERRALETLAAGGDFRAAFAALPHFQQLMAVEAYQSHLWNQTARAMATGLGVELARADDEFGEMLFPAAAAIPPQWHTQYVPMLAPTTIPDPAIAAPIAQALASESIALADLRISGLRRPAFGEAPRTLVARATHFSISSTQPDELGRPGRHKRTIRFDLPRGAYATVVLRALGQ